jgi:alpha-tubulin suppressor-like RCC1 family protein
MTLTVDSPPVITGIVSTPSLSTPVCSGIQVAFTVTATGTAPLTFVWKKNGTAVTNGPNTATFTISSIAAADSGQYSCAVSNNCSPITTSTNIQLKVTVPPVFTAPVKDTTLTKWAGDSITLTVAASGSGTLSYQWYKGTTPLGSATASSTKLIKPITVADSGRYSCVASNGCNPVTSKAIMLKVKAVAVVKVSIGDSHTMILKSDGTLWATGSNFYGELGDGTTTGRSTPEQIMSGVSSVSAGSGFTMILKTDSTLWATGWNPYGQLGDGTTSSRLTPVLVMSGTKAVSAGSSHTMIIKTDGTLWATGSNGQGQLGDGTTTDRNTPYQIMNGVAAVSCGGVHTMILKTDGTLWAAGGNTDGQLGDGTTTDRHSPYQITSSVRAVSSGGSNTLFIKMDGSLWGMGYNGFGQLGIGTTANALIPVQTMIGVAATSAGNRQTMVVKGDGSLWAMGFNDDGELGDGTTTERHLPEEILVNGINDGILTALTSLGNFSMIIKTDYSLWATGDNSFGQFGDGTTTNSLSPKLIVP